MFQELRKVVAGVIIQDGLYLVTQRGGSSSHPGKWEFPGGKVEEGEDDVQALRRELKEELDIDATISTWQCGLRFENERGPGVVNFYLIKEFKGTPRLIVAADLKWCTPDELLELDFMNSNGLAARVIVCQTEPKPFDAASRTPLVEHISGQPC